MLDFTQEPRVDFIGEVDTVPLSLTRTQRAFDELNGGTVYRRGQG